MFSITRSPTCECELVVVEVVVESLLKDTVSVRGQGQRSVLVRHSPEDDWKLERPKASCIIHITYNIQHTQQSRQNLQKIQESHVVIRRAKELTYES